MLEAFEKGGDFHSRTAMGMYPAIKKAVDNGEVLLEQDPSGAGQVPLLKDKYFKCSSVGTQTLHSS